MQPNTRIAVNTAFIYCRLIVVMGLTLFSTRYVLRALGEADFGIYNLIAGVVGLFAFIATTMAGTTQRYISYYMGEGDPEVVKSVFYNSCLMHLCIAAAVALLVELGGGWCIGHLLSIPADRVGDATFVLHCVTCGLVGTVLCVPFDALLMAHENILFVSAVQTLRAVLLFAVAVFLSSFSSDRLRIYALFMALIPYACLVAEGVYCAMKYPETRVGKARAKDASLIKSMGHFAGWVIIGVTCGTLRTQGTAILLNMFFGVLVNAANGVALQVNAAMQSFSSSVAVSIRPQLTKSIGCRDYGRMRQLTYAACKYPYLLMTLFAVPLIIAMPYVLQIWLEEVPDYSVTFCRLMLFGTMVSQISFGFTSAIEAHGAVKWLHLTAGLMHVAALPISWLLFRMGFPPPTIMWCIAAEEGINALIRLLLARHYLQIGASYYFREVVARSVVVTAIVAAVDCWVWRSMSATFGHFLCFLLIHTIVYAISCGLCGLNRNERKSGGAMLANGCRRVRAIFG